MAKKRTSKLLLLIFPNLLFHGNFATRIQRPVHVEAIFIAITGPVDLHGWRLACTQDAFSSQLIQQMGELSVAPAQPHSDGFSLDPRAPSHPPEVAVFEDPEPPAE